MEKRYQVFVSSTFEDLRDERASVISALLQIDCFPAGMELLPAADEDSLTLIKQVIDDSDYYLLILAGRYGSIETGSGKSYTQLEYEYALTHGKPTISLLHANPMMLSAAKLETTDVGRGRFDQFREELRKKNCRMWNNIGELTLAVFTGVQHLKRSRQADGWVKASTLPNEQIKDELLRVRRQLDSVSAELAQCKKRNSFRDSIDLAGFAETTALTVEFGESAPKTFMASWGEIFRSLLPQTIGVGASEVQILRVLTELAQEESLRQDDDTPPYLWKQAQVSTRCFGTVMNQMLAFGMVEGLTDTDLFGTRWRATQYGQEKGSRMVAIRRNVDDVPF